MPWLTEEVLPHASPQTFGIFPVLGKTLGEQANESAISLPPYHLETRHAPFNKTGAVVLDSPVLRRVAHDDQPKRILPAIYPAIRKTTSLVLP